MERNAELDPPKLKLEAGKFYIDRDGFVWCCFEVDPRAPIQAQANCIKLHGHRVEYFYLNGHYDAGGQREHTLIRELTTGLLDEDGRTRSIA